MEGHRVTSFKVSEFTDLKHVSCYLLVQSVCVCVCVCVESVERDNPRFI